MTTKKEKIYKIYQDNPHFTNQRIADMAGSSQSYVRKLIGGNNGRGERSIPEKVKSGHQWKKFRQNRKDFIQNYLPQKDYKQELNRTGDYSTNYYLPTDDQFSSAGSGSDFEGSWSQYEWLAERRVGIGAKVTRKPANDAVREGFKLLDTETKQVVPNDDLEQFKKDTDLMNQLARAIYYERVYGISFLVMYFGEDDKKEGMLSKPIQSNEDKVVAFEAIPPTHMAPVNVYESNKLNMNPQKWDLRGGAYQGSYEVHHERVRVFMSRPVVKRWYGLSIFEPIWDHIIPYYQAQIYLLRGFSKWGNMLVDYEIDESKSLNALYNKYADLIEDMKMNGTLIHTKNTDVGFNPTNLASGIQELIEVWLEGISAGTDIPVPIMVGRVTAAGLSGAAYLMAERNYWTMIRNIQEDFKDDLQWILEKSGFDLENTQISWNLTITKTEQQRLIDEGLKIENEIMKEQYIQTQIQTLFMLQELERSQQEGNGKEEGTDEEGIDREPRDNYETGGNGGNGSANKEKLNKVKKQATDVSRRDFISRDIMMPSLDIQKLRKERLNRIHELRKEVGS